MIRGINQAWERLFRDEEAIQVRRFECCFTITFLMWVAVRFLNWRDWLTSEGFHLSSAELSSMGYPQPWQPLSAFQAWLFLAAVVIGATLLLWPISRKGYGAKTRVCHLRMVGMWTLALCALLFQKVDFMAAFTLNKLYTGVFFLLAVAPNMQFSCEKQSLTQPAIIVHTLRCTLVLQYFAAGLAKMDGDWLLSRDVLWEHVQGVYRTDIAAWALRTMPRWSWTLQQHLSLSFEVLAPLLFFINVLRPIAIVVGVSFHLIIALMMKDLIYFSVQMLTFYILFSRPRYSCSESQHQLNSALSHETEASSQEIVARV